MRRGLGAFVHGDGVYGFRRAFTLAGAAAQIVTSWQVTDVPTAERLFKFYERARTTIPSTFSLGRNAKWQLIPCIDIHTFGRPPSCVAGPQALGLWDDI